MRRTLPKPKRKAGSPGPDQVEQGARDEALDLLEKWRGGLVEIGRDVAIRLARQRGRVTSVEVFATMRAQGYDAKLDTCDPRWMGVVFREEIWEREGSERTGSHARPVTIWKLRDPQNIPVSPQERVYRCVSESKERGVTTGEVVLSTNLKGSQVRRIFTALVELDRIMSSSRTRRGTSGRPQRIYVLPEYHPEII